VCARRLGQGGLARSARRRARARKSVVGGLASCARARGFDNGVENLGFCCVD